MCATRCPNDLREVQRSSVMVAVSHSCGWPPLAATHALAVTGDRRSPTERPPAPAPPDCRQASASSHGLLCDDCRRC
eukprot:4441166-Prymnesium_polylepis.1